MLLAALESTLHVPGWAWGALVAGLVGLLMVDLFVVNRDAHEITMREAAVSSTVWIMIGLAFSFVVLGAFGTHATGEYLSGYLIEKSLSVDNVFVWALIFNHFAVPAAYQHRVLFWGIFGALVLRALFIFAGVAIIERFEPVLYLFGAFLLWTAWKLIRNGDDHVDPSTSPFLRLVRRLVPSVDHYEGAKLFVKQNGRRLATPLFAVLVVVEGTDVLFAVDSVPAVLAVSQEQFIVFASNAFAILGLRALYFLLAAAEKDLPYLQQGLAVILAFVGSKMLLHHWLDIPIGLSLAVIAAVLAVAIVASVRSPQFRSTGEV